jgi:prolyl-tRNA editing enzyme YbaK/EbsC (Cys-tRNA(Pro) deacylase)
MTTTIEPLPPSHVQATLDALGFGIAIRYFDATTATSQQAADNIGCELGQIVKSIAFIVEEQPVIVLTSGDQRVDDKKVAAHYNVGRKKVRVATPEELVAIYGYEPGSVPPLAHRTQGIHVYIDQTLQRFDQLYAAGGAHNTIFPVTMPQLLQMSSGKIMDVVRTTLDANS